jgi:hypothetical protein
MIKVENIHSFPSKSFGHFWKNPDAQTKCKQAVLEFLCCKIISGRL